jgi:hypothetical protein
LFSSFDYLGDPGNGSAILQVMWFVESEHLGFDQKTELGPIFHPHDHRYPFFLSIFEPCRQLIVILEIGNCLDVLIRHDVLSKRKIWPGLFSLFLMFRTYSPVGIS